MSLLRVLAVLVLLPAPREARAGEPAAPAATPTARAEPEAAPEPDKVAPDGCAPPVDEDPSTIEARAEDHYQRGEELYNKAGDYEAAIREYFAAYCLVPDQEKPIYNIGQAYERLVDYEMAVLWFERYIRLMTGSRHNAVVNRVAILRRLPARFRVATEPPGASIVLENRETRVAGKANARDPLKVPAGDYQLRVELKGHEPVTEAVHAEIGQPYTYSFRLEPQTGAVRVQADPADARIFVDQKLVAVGTYVDRLPVGPHELTVEAEGRPAESRSLRVSADKTSLVFVKLPAPPKSGRTELLVASTAFGLSAGGTLSTVTLGKDADSPVSAAFVIGGGAIGFAGPWLGAPAGVPVGTSSFIIGATAWGAGEGYAAAYSFTDDPAVIGSVALGASIAFGAGALLTAGRLDLSAGDAALLNSGALWGATTGGLFYAAFNRDSRLQGPLVLAGLNAGLLAGVALARRYELSRGHVALIDLAGLAGGVTGVAIAGAFAQGGQKNRQEHFALGGISVGLIVGALLTRRFDDRASRSTTLAGRASPLPSPALGAADDAAGGRVPVYGLAGTF